ncbi:SDR family NAD(P)-dependent oxidoreductase [Pseudomonas sp. 1 R 17]|uniref:SDR family NAD(P)-dependent oxidoreductase n=1 Tax=Pseudomonas sp. 1 R 17 TaxID=1844091 RepID=UPI00081268D3|nr:SDR family oxidoreductase [Pseudomonas sp. 1 R 17]SAM32843.1 3-oxoacyl-[acyl-carrier-protein] reductase FabG [Pseudomonas sp. 1 R 17]
MKEGKYAVVTGASSGIGYALSQEAASSGYNLIMVANHKERLNYAAERLAANYQVTVKCLSFDLSNADELSQLILHLSPYLEVIEVFINNAGVGRGGSFLDTDVVDHSALIETNVRALTVLSHFIAQHFVRRGKGYLLNVASLAAFQPGPYYANYYASKAYVLHFTEALAVELRKKGVRCAALCPGTTQTAFHLRAGSVDTGLAKGLFGIVMSPEEVARIGFKGLLSNRVVIVPGLVNKLAMQSVRISPRWLARQITAMINQ